MRRLLGTTLIVAPLLVIASESVAPTLSESGSTTLADLGTHLTAFRFWVWGGMAAAAVLVAAIAALVHLAPGRRLTHVGASLAVVGVVGYAAHQGAFLPLPSLVHGDRSQMAALYERQGQSADLGILIFLVFLVPLFLGLTLLGVSAYRAGSVPLWPAVCLALAFVPGFLPLPESVDAGLISFLLLLLGLGAYGVTVLRMSDAQWTTREGQRRTSSSSMKAGRDTASPMTS